MQQLLVALGPCIHHFTVIPLSNLAFTFFGLSAFRISQSHAAFHWSYQCGSIFVVVCLGFFFFLGQSTSQNWGSLSQNLLINNHKFESVIQIYEIPALPGIFFLSSGIIKLPYIKDKTNKHFSPQFTCINHKKVIMGYSTLSLKSNNKEILTTCCSNFSCCCFSAVIQEIFLEIDNKADENSCCLIFFSRSFFIITNIKCFTQSIPEVVCRIC